jgi:glycerol-3-phosphate acyltransferase PlsY
MRSLAITAALAYLLGSIPFGYLLVRIFRGEDVRRSGSGNIGATNVSRKSPVLGVLTLLLDALKGFASVMAAILLSPPATVAIISYRSSWYQFLSQPKDRTTAAWAAAAALCAVIGHMFPVWLKFRGGKGVATGLGSFLIIAPKAVLVAVILFAAVVAISRYVSLGSIIAVVAFPFAVLLLHEYGNSPMAIALISLASVLIIAKHHANIRRLLAGSENRLGSRRLTSELSPGQRR